MKLTVIMTTYNAAVWLEKVLWGFSAQTHTDFEIIIGDDGSTAETGNLIARMQQETGLRIRHLWHEDAGFRKCEMLNKAILHAESEYLVFTDGDCIPRKDFLAVHAQQAEQGRYLSGGYCKLPMQTSQAICREDVLSGCCFDLKWLVANGLKHNHKHLKLMVTYGQAAILNRITLTKCNLKGSNASVWLNDALAVEGFDTRMQWGGLDREFGVRLINNGIKPKHVRYNAVCIHLDHGRGYKDAKKVKANKELRMSNARNRVKRTAYGISRLLEDGYVPEEETLAVKLWKRQKESESA